MILFAAWRSPSGRPKKLVKKAITIEECYDPDGDVHIKITSFLIPKYIVLLIYVLLKERVCISPGDSF